MAGLNSDELVRYSRHIMLPEVGLEGQQKLKNASVLIVGAGGLGAPVALYLAASGIGKIGIVDFDVVDSSNLQRQILHSTKDIGKKKIDSAKKRLKDLNPSIEIDIYDEQLTSKNAVDLIKGYDIVVDGTDNFPTRYLVNDVCMFLNKPNVYASIFGFEGQATVFQKKSGPCYRCLFPNPPKAGSVPSCHEAGVFGVLPGILGTIQATEVVKLVLNIGDSLKGRLLSYDALQMQFSEIRLSRNPNCPVCGDKATITEPIDYDSFCSRIPANADTRQKAQVKEMLPKELKRNIDSGKDIILLDVREKQEREICKLEDSIHIPLVEITDRIHEIPERKEIVVYCHLGVRSRTVAEYLTDRGFKNVINLKGGIDLYSVECDPTIPRY